MDDLISRQAAIDALKRDEEYDEDIPNRADGVRDAIITIMGLPSAQPTANDALEDAYAHGYTYAESKFREMLDAQPEIIRCRNCKFASGDSRICMKFGHSPIGELDFCAWAERRTDE